MMSADNYYIKQVDGSLVSTRELQLKSLEILEYFDSFCSAKSIKYTLCGGCCIGALRHGGFIPWDDDIDVHMKRKDYEKFYRLWQNNIHPEKYKLLRTRKKEFIDSMLTQLSDQETTFIKLNQVDLDIDHGIKLEIIPLDGAPENKIKRKVQLFWALIFYLFNRGFAPENRGKAANLIGKALLFLVPGKRLRYYIWSFAERQMARYDEDSSPYLTELTVTWKYMKLRYPRAIFEGERRELFEGRLYPVPYKAEDYLKMAFGDFMKLQIGRASCRERV